MSDNPSLDPITCPYCNETKPRYLFTPRKTEHRKWMCKSCNTSRGKAYAKKLCGKPAGNDWGQQRKLSWRKRVGKIN